MITFQEGTYEDTMLHKDFKMLLEENWQETGFLNTTYQLSPNMNMYKTLADQGILSIYAMKDQDLLMGYFIAVILPHPHFADVLVAETDTFFVSKKYRKGLSGYKFLQYIIEDLKKKVNLIILTTNMKRDLSNLLNRLNFKLADYRFILEV